MNRSCQEVVAKADRLLAGAECVLSSNSDSLTAGRRRRGAVIALAFGAGGLRSTTSVSEQRPRDTLPTTEGVLYLVREEPRMRVLGMSFGIRHLEAPPIEAAPLIPEPADFRLSAPF